MSNKPDKILYKSQRMVWKKAEKYLVNLVKPHKCVSEAVVWASLAEGQFGLYEEEYRGREGSDIDLVILIDEKHSLPNEWKFTAIEKSCFDLYRLGSFIYNGNTHEIDGLLVFPSKHKLKDVQIMLDGRSKLIYNKKTKSLLLNARETKQKHKRGVKRKRQVALTIALGESTSIEEN